MKFNTEYFIQSYTCEDGNIARFIIPENATEDDIRGIKETLDVIFERHFKVLMKDRIELANKALRLEKAIEDIKAEIKEHQRIMMPVIPVQEVFEIIDKHINGIRKEKT